jgi:SAM-dependent methyltransferase
MTGWPVVGLTLTGERTLPGMGAENYWFRRHEAAYRLLAPSCVGALVLDVGCGEGYGTELLRQAGARRVLGVDYDCDVVQHVRHRYPSVSSLRANAVSLPFRDASIDVVVALQVIEHLWEQQRFVQDCARVLRTGGRMLLTTPNRVTFATPEMPRNPFHSHELSADELIELTTPFFDVTVHGLRHGARLRQWEVAHGSIVAAQLASGSDSWPEPLQAHVACITIEDFELHDDADAALDLMLVGLRR